jgi:hypothetical protein
MVTMSNARRIAASISPHKWDSWDWSVVRDVVDGATFGELDPFQLDMLTDWVDNLCKQRATTSG